jgi:hypothetical protein
MTETPSPGTATPLIFGRYRIIEELGEGRLATVYRATDERLRRTVLLHLLRKELSDREQLHRRFMEIAHATAQCSHPALLEVFDSGTANDRPYMITEDVTGRPLRALGVLTPEQALLYMRQITNAVALCEERKQPHPPISSSNIVVAEEGRVKLVEGWFIPPDEIPLDVAHYRAPERTEGQPASAASTVYSLGMLFYELITGTRPVTGSDPWAISQAHLTARIPPIAQVRPLLYLPALERLIGRAIARDPARRIATAAALSEALDKLWRELTGDTQRLPVPPAPRRPQPQRTPEAAPLPIAPAPAPAPAPPLARPPEPAYAPPQPVAPAQPAAPRKRRRRDQGPRPLDTTTLRQKAWQHGLRGWIAISLLLLVVAFVSYAGATYVVDRVFAIDIGFGIPDWLPGTDPGEVYVVSDATALNIRDQPGLTNSNVITALPNGTRVRKLEGPVMQDNVPWVRVRAEVEDQTIEGWVSENFLVPLE